MTIAYVSSLLFTGFFAAAAAYSGALYVATREKPFLWYAALSVASAASQLVYLESLPVRVASFSLFVIAQWAFACAFLQIDRRSSRLQHTLQIVTGIAVAMLLAQSMGSIFGVRMIGHAAFVAMLALCAYAAWDGVRYRLEDRIFFFAGFAGAALSAVLSTFADATAQGSWAQYLFQFGLAWQSSFLALALGNRYVKLDPLTGVKSRREFDERLPKAWRTAHHEKKGLAVVFVRVEDFAAYNAKHGRLAADAVLRRISHLCAGCCRDRADLFARYGDAEFAAIVPRVTQEQADAIAARMRDLVEQACQVRIHARAASLDTGAQSAPALLNDARTYATVS